MTAPVLGIETTCDETSAAVLDERGRIMSLVVHSQDVHRLYGGVVPELAARDHLRRIEPVAAEALAGAGVARSELAAVAAAVAPGLIGALLVGVAWSRATAFALNVPFVPVHHMEGHLFAPLLEDPEAEPPFTALIVSGGHTLLLWVPAWGDYVLLGRTRDDAAGEAFDKVARLLGLPYPGGPAVQAAAEDGDPARHALPRPLLGGGGRPPQPDDFDFSFSGLKTAVARLAAGLENAGALERETPHVAASFQEAAVDVLATKTLRAARAMGCERVLLGGGVSANRALRQRVRDEVGPGGRIFAASPRLSLDNGAMIARAAQFRLQHGSFGGLAQADASAPMPGLRPWRPPAPGKNHGDLPPAPVMTQT